MAINLKKEANENEVNENKSDENKIINNTEKNVDKGGSAQTTRNIDNINGGRETSEFLKLDKPKNIKKPSEVKKKRNRIIKFIVFVIIIYAVRSCGRSDDEIVEKSDEVTPTQTKEIENIDEVRPTLTKEVEKVEEVEEKTPVPEPEKQAESKKLKLSNIGMDDVQGEPGTYILYGTITNVTSDIVYTNFGMRVEVYGKEDIILTQNFNVFTDEVIEPGESKQFEVVLKFKGQFKNVWVTILTADEVQGE